MNKSKTLLIGVAALVVIGVGFRMMNSDSNPEAGLENADQLGNSEEMLTDPNSAIGEVTGNVVAPKEFTMTAFYEMKDGKAAPQYSMNAISVKKGDAVRIKITNTKGTHDFVIDEYKVASELPLNQEVVVEFTADKAGTFTYYCSKPGHRAGGQFGTLTVTE